MSYRCCKLDLGLLVSTLYEYHSRIYMILSASLTIQDNSLQPFHPKSLKNHENFDWPPKLLDNVLKTIDVCGTGSHPV
jgi:hypothetical protein